MSLESIFQMRCYLICDLRDLFFKDLMLVWILGKRHDSEVLTFIGEPDGPFHDCWATFDLLDLKLPQNVCMPPAEP